MCVIPILIAFHIDLYKRSEKLNNGCMGIVLYLVLSRLLL